LQTPSFAGREQDFANETFEAQYRERIRPVSAGEAKAALASLPADTQRGVGQLVAEHGAGAREHLAYQALGEWTPEEREGLRTLAAASPEIRAQAVDDAGHRQADAGGGPVGEAPVDAGPRGPVYGTADSSPSQASPPPAATGDSGHMSGPIASARPDSVPPASRPPTREPRGPSPDELSPNE
jgi:hypothetical protein